MKWWQIRKRDADLERELQSDLELEEAEQRANGLSAEEAHHAAQRAFGNTTLIREHIHEAWGWAPVERLLQDARYAMRQLWRSPGFSIVAMMTLALGIGATTAIFTLVYDVMLRPLPFARPNRIVTIEEKVAEWSNLYPTLPVSANHSLSGNSTTAVSTRWRSWSKAPCHSEPAGALYKWRRCGPRPESSRFSRCSRNWGENSQLMKRNEGMSMLRSSHMTCGVSNSVAILAF
jgi:hypothetical protein